MTVKKYTDIRTIIDIWTEKSTMFSTANVEIDFREEKNSLPILFDGW